MKTIANVYLLPSDKESRLHITPEGLLYQSLEPFIQDCKDYKSFHLYITLPQSNLEISKIKEGDWCFETLNKVKFQVKNNTNDYSNSSFEKIIATTDTSLNLNSIPQSFIEYFIAEYNKGNVIKQIEVELVDNGDEDWIGDNENREPIWIENIELKLNQQKEISIILPEEKMYSRNEVENLILNAMRYINKYIIDSDTLRGQDVKPIAKKWIKGNLK